MIGGGSRLRLVAVSALRVRFGVVVVAVRAVPDGTAEHFMAVGTHEPL